MPDDELLEQNAILQADNARLRRLLERHGPPAGLRHQVRNTLALVRNVVRQSAARYAGADDFIAHLESRLDAILRIQNAVAGAPLDGVDLGVIITNEFLAQSLTEGDRFTIDGPEVRLRPEAAGLFGLAIHELAINAIKFGAASTPRGRLAVSWRVDVADDGRPWLALRWAESGVEGGPPSPPHRGFGSDVIETALPYQLDGRGRIDLAPGGVVCTIGLPLSREGDLR